MKGLILGVALFGLAWAVYPMVHTPPPAPAVRVADVECYTNPSSFLVTEGWMRLFEADRLLVARLVGDGKAEVMRQQSLVCRDYSRPDSIERVVVSEWWWRRK